MSRLDNLIAGRYQIVAFRDLPVPYQLALVRYMAIDGEAWDDLMGLSYGVSETAIKKAMLRMLPQYVMDYGDCKFGVAVLPVAEVQQSVMASPEIQAEFGSWEAYHTWYAGSNSVPEHPDTERWPVILSSYDDETLQDGSHRLHSYVQAGHSDIPAVFYPERRHLSANVKKANKQQGPSRPRP